MSNTRGAEKSGGVAEALDRIATVERSRAKVLDLGGLGLDDAALEDIGNRLARLEWLETLYLGLLEKDRKKLPHEVKGDDKVICNAVRALPPALLALPHLKHLDLSWNQLAVLPPDIGRLTALTYLSLDHNQLTALPPDIGRLTALTALNGRGNQLTALPPDIGRLSALTHLNLSTNQLAALPPEIGQLAALTTLYVGGNQLTALPPDIGRLTVLTHFLLLLNKLTALPPDIGRLSALIYLSLSHNQLTALPPEIGRLTALTHLDLSGNPLVTPPPEIVSQGVDAIRRFLRATARTGRPVYEAKVVLVGEAGVGKTQLRQWLLTGEFREPGASTRALEVRTCGVPNPHDARQPGHIHIWDFGGQDEYRPSQQLFFTTGALYLMLFNGRKGIADGRVEEWLRLIRLRVGPRARVLLVATNAIETDISPSLNELPRDLLDMCVRQPDGRPLRINSRESDGRPVQGLLGPDGLIARVHKETAHLDAFKQHWPGEWLDARDAALSPANYNERDGAPKGGVPPVIYFETFQRIAREKKVAEDQIHDLATALSLSGRLTYKGDRDAPGQLVVLDSEWLMKAIGYVLSAPEVKTTGGVLRRAHLNRIWITHAGLSDSERRRAITYPAHMHEHLLLLMTKHDISYRLNDDSWLVGQCVSDAMPNPVPWSFAGRPKGPALGLTCKLSDKIHGLASLLTVRNHFHHADIKDHAWQRGVFLRHPVQKAEALIQVDGERHVDIETRGPDAGVFISELKGSLDKIITDTWRAAGAAASKPYVYRVPCPTCEDGSYGYDDLRTDYLRGKTDSSCEGGKRCDNKVTQLLEGFSRATDLTPEMRTQMRAATNEPPHIITITKASGGLFGAMLSTKYRIDIHCEYTEQIVPQATETLAFDTRMWTALQEWGPGLFVSAAKAAMGLDLELPEKREIKRRNQELKAAVERLGRLERAPQTYIEKEFGDLLAQIGRRAGMSQIEMHNDGRLLWVAPEIARGQDPNLPKSQT